MTGQEDINLLGYIIRKDELGYIWANPAERIEGDIYHPTAEDAIEDCETYIASIEGDETLSEDEDAEDSIGDDDDNWGDDDD